MKYKILTPNENGKFEFTKEELEKFMEELYDEGYNEGKKHTITTPFYPDPITHPYVTWSDKTTPIHYDDKTTPIKYNQYDTWMCTSTTPTTGDINNG
jgi:hypothetical protein